MEMDAGSEADLLAKYGVMDEASGRRNAVQARDYLLTVATSVIREGDFNMDQLIVAGIVARTQSLHEAALDSINSDNPHAAFTLLRAYIEQCAAILYLTDHPAKAERLWKDPDGHGVPVGRMTSYADSSGRFTQFRRIYDLLSRYAHPSSISHFAALRMSEGNHFTFQTAHASSATRRSWSPTPG